METAEETRAEAGVEDPAIDGTYEEEGVSIADMTENGEGPEEEQGPPPVEGRNPQLSLFAGGEDPDGAMMVLRGGQLAVEGEFEKGDYITLTVKARVAEIHFVDKTDGDGYVVSTTRKHVAKVESVRRSED